MGKMMPPQASYCGNSEITGASGPTNLYDWPIYVRPRLSYTCARVHSEGELVVESPLTHQQRFSRLAALLMEPKWPNEKIPMDSEDEWIL